MKTLLGITVLVATLALHFFLMTERAAFMRSAFAANTSSVSLAK